MSGASTGAAPLMIIIRLKARAATAPCARSATTARLSTTPAAPLNPCTKRNAVSAAMFGATAQATPARMQTKVPASMSGRLPNRSESGPMINCPLARPTMNEVRVN